MATKAKTPSLADRLGRTVGRQTGPRCWYSASPEDAREFASAAFSAFHDGVMIDGAVVTVRGIARVLREDWGIKTTETSIGRHFRGDCICSPEAE